MRTHISVVTTKEDLLNYFKPEDPRYPDAATWESTEREGTVVARSDMYVVNMKPKSIQFAAEIEAYEDPSDSDYEVTDDPVRFIVDFLKTGTLGDEALEKMASVSPDIIVGMLRLLASDIDTKAVSRQMVQRVLRRFSVSIDFDFAKRVLIAVTRSAAREEIEEKEINDLKSQMEKKGWKVEVGKSDIDLPQLNVDVSGIYKAKISVDSIVWETTYEISNMPETQTTEITDDPIAAFKKWRKSDSVKSAREEAASRKKERPEEQEKGTVPPPRRGKPEPQPEAS